LDRTLTNDQGGYDLTVPSNTTVRIQARAQLLESLTGAPRWSVTVEDNTNNDAEYILAGALASSGTTDSTRNLFAPSGSNGASAYTGPRTAAPFFMLDEILNGLRLVETADASLILPVFRVLWSTENRLINDDEDPDIANGDLTSTFFSTNVGGIPSIVVLGDIMTDTDEYDEHVVTHEFGHYLTFVVTRDDSIGGPHSLSNRLDPRLSFSEGFGNAFSAMATGDPLYVDAGFGNDDGFAFSVELNTIGQIIENNSGIPAAGWYGESSVQSIIFDLFDSNSDDVDNISLGFAPIFSTLQSSAYQDDTSATTLFSYINAMIENNTVTATQVEPLLTFQEIDGTGSFAVGETNDGDIPLALPVYQTYTAGDPAITICSIDDAGTINRIANRALISLNVPQAGTFTITMSRISGLPDDVETQSRFLPAGQLYVDAHDFNNISQIDDLEPGDACYAFSVQ